MNAENLIKNIRNLSKSTYYQSIYSIEKNVGVKLFKNDMDLAPYQLTFLNYLGFYSNIYLDVYLGEVDEKVLDNFIYEDAYSYWKSKHRKEETKQLQQHKTQPQSSYTSQWIFKNKNRIKEAN